jgi:cysteinyl-tRNA synthetase
LLSALQSVDEVLGILQDEHEGDLLLDIAIAEKIQVRERARLEKDFALADKIRQELVEDGIVLEDTKDGTRWKRIRQK